VAGVAVDHVLRVGHGGEVGTPVAGEVADRDRVRPGVPAAGADELASSGLAGGGARVEPQLARGLLDRDQVGAAVTGQVAEGGDVVHLGTRPAQDAVTHRVLVEVLLVTALA
jgi:hypothetical protein